MKHSFLSLVVDDLILKAGGLKGLGQFTIVLPMHRAGIYMKKILRQRILDEGKRVLESGKEPKPVLLPRFTTINSLIDSLSIYAPDDEIRSVCMLYDIYREKLIEQQPDKANPMPLDVFYNWGKQLITDFGNIDKSNVDGLSLLRNSVDAKRLEKLPLDDDTLQRLKDLFPLKPRDEQKDKTVHEQFEQLWNLLPDIYEQFHTALRGHQMEYQGARLKEVIASYNRWGKEVEDRRFAFVGFNYLQEGEKELFRLLKENNNALFYWDYRADFQTNPIAYHFLSDNMQRFPNALSDNSSSSQPQAITMIASATANVQAQYVRQWLSDHKDEAGTMGIVIADESLLEPVLYAIPEEFASRVNITKGYPMRSTVVYAQILAFMEKKCDTQVSQSGEQVLQEMLDDLLAMPQEVENEASLFTDEQEDEPITWQQQLQQESTAKARSVISRLVGLFQDGTLPLDTSMRVLTNILRRELEQATISFAGEPITDIQIIGVLETRLLDFDHLLVLGVEEGILPSTQQDKSFIPYYLRKYYGLQTNDEGAWAYSYNFFRLLRRASDVTLVFVSETDNGHKGMSRFLMQMLTCPQEFMITKKRLTENTVTIMSVPDIEQIADNAQFKKRGDHLTVSPSAISTYLSCPRKFFLQYLLRLDSPASNETLLPANDLGSLIHGVLHEAYMSMTGGKMNMEITEDKINAFLSSPENMLSALEKAYKLMNDDYCKHHPNQKEDMYYMEEHPLENEVALYQAKRILEYDKSKTPFRILALEKPVYTTLNMEGVGTISIGGTIDRIDQMEENGKQRIRIVDYKTGKYEKNKTHADRLDNLFVQETPHGYMLQTLIYCLACLEQKESDGSLLFGEDLMPILIFIGKNLKDFDPHLFINDEAIWSFKDDSENFRNQLVALLKEIFKSTNIADFPMCEENKCSAYCPFLSLCNRKVQQY